MEGHLQNSPKLGCPFNSEDVKYVSGLSTILVATIQEAKDRISQIEYIFCSQLYPNFQSKSKSLQKIYSEARKAADDEWKKKENDYVLQIERLQFEKQQALEENKSLKFEMEKPSMEQEENTNQLLAKIKSQQLKIDVLEQKLKQKSKEVDEGMELQNKLIQSVQSKASEIVDKGKQLKAHEEKTNVLLDKVYSLKKKVAEFQQELRGTDEEVAMRKELQEKIESQASKIRRNEQLLDDHEKEKNLLMAKLEHLEESVGRLQEKLKKKTDVVDELQEELRGKTREVAKEKEFQENLFKKIQLQASKIMTNTQLLNDHEKEKNLLMVKLERLEESVSGLQEELKTKTHEVEEGRQLQNQLLQQIDLNNSELLKNKQQLQECENEKKLLLAKVIDLEGKINEVQLNLRGRSSDIAEGNDSYEKLLQQIETKASELLAEKKKRKDLFDLYKKLKSQYNYLCSRYGLIMENMLPQSDSLRHNQNSATLPDLEHKISDTSVAAYDMNIVKNEINFSESLEDEKGAKLIQTSSSDSPTSSFPIASKCPSDVKSAPIAGTKRPASSWRDTRSRHGGPDPHDDFLDTPFENIRGNLNKVLKEEVRDPPVPIQKDVNIDSLDDETQDMNVGCSPQKEPMPVSMAAKKGFKYVEPVRKKADRQNLKGIECKQCKKFFDAVLPNDGGKGTDDNKGNFRCEHHDGVSRHRYRYAPPMTPEGFWNIGFESEM